MKNNNNFIDKRIRYIFNEIEVVIWKNEIFRHYLCNFTMNILYSDSNKEKKKYIEILFKILQDLNNKDKKK